LGELSKTFKPDRNFKSQQELKSEEVF